MNDTSHIAVTTANNGLISKKLRDTLMINITETAMTIEELLIIWLTLCIAVLGLWLAWDMRKRPMADYRPVQKLPRADTRPDHVQQVRDLVSSEDKLRDFFEVK